MTFYCMYIWCVSALKKAVLDLVTPEEIYTAVPLCRLYRLLGPKRMGRNLIYSCFQILQSAVRHADVRFTSR